MKLRKLVHAAMLIGTLAFSGTAWAENPQGFIQREHEKLTQLLKQPASSQRDSQVTQTLAAMVDYDELARRSFGQPCPGNLRSCKDHWSELTDAQKNEMRDLLKRLVEKNYRKNLMKTLDYEVTYKGVRDQGGESRIRTEAKSKVKPRDPAVQVDYVVRSINGGYRIVDIYTEGSSLTKNYYDQFHRMLTTQGQGYSYAVKKLKEKLAKKD